MLGLARVASGVTLAILALYHLLRSLAATCTGPACEGYIIPSLLIPLLVLGAAAITGLVAVLAARERVRGATSTAARHRYGVWLAVLVACTLLSVLGPFAAAFIWRDNPAAVVLTATLLVLLIPISVLLFSFVADRSNANSLMPTP